MPLTAAQCRAARALLNWSQEDLVRHAGSTRKIVADFEREATRPHPKNMARITAAFEAGGIEFLNRKGQGVLLKGTALRNRKPSPSGAG